MIFGFIPGKGFAFPKWTSCVSTTLANKRVESKARIKRAFLFTGHHCLLRDFSVVKAFLSRFLD